MSITSRHSDQERRFSISPKATWAETSIVVGFWVLLFLLSIVQRATDVRGPEGLTQPEIFHTGIEYLSWLVLTPIVFWLVRRYNYDKGDWTKKVLVHVGAAVMFSIVMQIITRESFYTLIHTGRPRHMTLGESLGNLRFLDELFIYLFILFAGFARDYFYRYRENVQETIRLRTQSSELHAQLADAKVQALRMQLNPHFLFNTLNAISTLIEHNPSKAKEMIVLLGDLLRYSLDDSENHEVTLNQETKFLRSYLDIQKVRFEDKLSVREDLPLEHMKAKVPSLILQPIVENSIKHGISKMTKAGLIEISVRKEGDYLNIQISDNGPGLFLQSGDGAPSSSGGLGLKNTQERLRELYGENQSFSIKNRDGGGVTVIIRLPYKLETDSSTLVRPRLEK